ncbi:MAG: beta-lactamase family protein [Kiritimatiellaeota bacterium]|nr:beta-lactamase family protein [Kiritimatiellota bacterium]
MNVMAHARVFAGAAGALMLAAGGAGAQTAAASAQVHARVAALREKYALPSLAAAVVSDQGLQAWGMTGVDTNSAVLWHLGSNTKAMTASLVGLLVEQGRVSWDTKIADIFPNDAKGFHADYAGLTLRHLLAHRGGVRPNLDWWALHNTQKPIREQRLDAMRQGLAEKPAFPPGSGTLYANLGYVIAGAVIERKLNMTWEDAMRRRLFAPLKMKHAGFGELYAGDVDNAPVLGPAGRVHCTLEDWALFIADQVRGAQGKAGLLRPATYRELHAPVAGGDAALGWFCAERAWGGGRVLTHNGSNTRHFSTLWLAPQRGMAFIACTRQGDDTAAKACDEAVGILATGTQ